MKSVTGIIQARIGASRLPNKMMLSLHGYPICEWVFRRVSESNLIDKIVFALPDTKQNNILEYYLQSIGAKVIRGSETDLVGRFLQAAQGEKLKKDSLIIRICADNPLICASEIDRLIGYFIKTNCDYAYNHMPKNNKYPDGLGAEICSMGLLEEIGEKSDTLEYREHLFNYIWDNQDKYIVKTFQPPEELAYPEIKLDVDTMEDYKELLSKNYRIDMTAREIIDVAKL